MIRAILILFVVATGALFADYERLDSASFEEKIVGNTVVGVTRQSKSLYMLYFAADGSSLLWKQAKLFTGAWWADQDGLIHAHWPEYQSSEPGSLFHPDNPRYGNATSVSYLASTTDPHALIIATKSFQIAALLVPGNQIPE